jgi:hypothetical protein
MPDFMRHNFRAQSLHLNLMLPCVLLDLIVKDPDEPSPLSKACGIDWGKAQNFAVQGSQPQLSDPSSDLDCEIDWSIGRGIPLRM